ncbi:MAG: redoxin family protein, partial [Kiritimatiellae bacterium]|nr:redoxin family protein [Kiritimatiellia bacterium]
APKGKSMKVAAQVTLSNWALNPEIADSEFGFAPPADAEKVDTLRSPRRTRSPMEGTVAPDFVLDLLDGGKLDLAALKEKKKVLILSFWTAQHPIGVSGLAMILPVVKQYEDKGVIFYAVNVRDTPEVARKALTEKGLSCPVALDRDAQVAKRYGMRSFFHTVIIREDGIIARVFLTLPADLRTVLAAELDALLAGREAGVSGGSDVQKPGS